MVWVQSAIHRTAILSTYSDVSAPTSTKTYVGTPPVLPGGAKSVAGAVCRS